MARPLDFRQLVVVPSTLDTMNDMARMLQSIGEEGASTPGSINPRTRIGLIFWYCLLSVCCFLVMLACCVGYSYHMKRRNQRNNQELEMGDTLDSSLSRMEANIHVFSEQQAQRRKRALIQAFEKHALLLAPRHLNDSKVSSKLSEGCSICLTNYKVGDSVVQSSNKSCQDLFHQECIASWLITRQSPLCPCCRQLFMHGLYKYSFSTSSDNESTEGSSSSRHGGDSTSSTSRSSGDSGLNDSIRDGGVESISTLMVTTHSSNDIHGMKEEIPVMEKNATNSLCERPCIGLRAETTDEEDQGDRIKHSLPTQRPPN